MRMTMLRTITLASDGRPLVRLHYYATHPQTFCCDGRVSGDRNNALTRLHLIPSDSEP